jgi:hypothetical protein
MLRTANDIVEREGITGLYKGLEGQLVKGLVSQGVMMLVKQRYVYTVARHLVSNRF